MRFAWAIGAWVALAACSPTRDVSVDPGRTRIVFVHQPLWGEAAHFEALLDRFRRANPDVELVTQTIPSASDLAHQYFLTALEGRSEQFDVFVADVVWVAEFARAGWLADLSDAFPPEVQRADFLPGPVEATVLEGRTRAVPWYADVGLLYFRTDLVPGAPRTWEALRTYARDAMTKDPSLQGYVWQARQYEGLVCNVAEAVWGFGGELEDGVRVRIDSPEAVAAVSMLRALVADGLSPPGVTSGAEEESRRAFQSGRAVFMRNWPYAWALLQEEGSPVRGRVAVAALPTASGEPGAGTLGGWQLAVNAHVSERRRVAAAKLVGHLTSLESMVALAVSHARIPARPAAFEDPVLREKAPFIADLRPHLERARPRPVTPYYLLITDALQGELSAAIVGIRPPAQALHRAQLFVDHVTGVDR